MKETTSTMDEARRIAKMGFPPGSLVASDLQSAGRGRFHERSWESRPGANLLFTLCLAPGEVATPALPLRAGLALCRAVDVLAVRMGQSLSAPAMLKWPNDLLIGGKKAAGVLCEAGSDGVFVGVGLNCNQRGFPLPLEGKVTSLALEFGHDVDRWLVLEIFLTAFSLLLLEEDWKEGVNERLWMRGKKIPFLVGLPQACDLVVGRLEGIDDAGSLVIDAQGGEDPRAYPAGEIVVDVAPGPHSRPLAMPGPS